MATIMASPATQTSVQRGPCTTIRTPSGRYTMKRRASRACQCCRSKKIKCDVVDRGIPCTRCRLEKFECSVVEAKNKTLRRSRKLSSHSTDPSHNLPNETQSVPPAAGLSGQDTAVALDGFLSTLPLGLLDLELNHRMSDQTRGQDIDSGYTVDQTSLNTGASPPSLPSPTGSSNHHLSDPQHCAPCARLPQYIRPLPPNIEADDIDFLKKKGALTVPEGELCNELLRNYVLYVHPDLPLLELKEFLVPIERNDGSLQISLLLFQAVMFAATAYVDMRFLRAQGYDDRKAARKIFFKRAKLLYDVDYELNRISIVQALLLLTSWYDKPNEQKDNSYWMRTSLSVAYTIGLNHNNENSKLDVKTQRLWKRVWWSCFVRDRIITLAMRCPALINSKTHNVPTLVVEDFDLEPLPAELGRMLAIDYLCVRDNTTRSVLARMFIEKVKLCFCVHEVLTAQYSVILDHLGRTAETTIVLAPKKSTFTAETLETLKCDHELEQWNHTLAEDIKYQRPRTEERVNETDGVLMVQRALLRLIYLTTMSALHRPQVLPTSPTTAVAAFFQEHSRTRIKEAAIDVNGIAQDLNEQGLVRFLPSTVVQALIPAIIIHLADIRSNDPMLRDAGSRRYHQSVNVLRQLRERYAAADFAFTVLEVATKRANVDLPQDKTIIPATYSNIPRSSRGPAMLGAPLIMSLERHPSSSNILHSSMTEAEPEMSMPMTSSEAPVDSSILSTSMLSAMEGFDVAGFDSNIDFSIFFDQLIDHDGGRRIPVAGDGSRASS